MSRFSFSLFAIVTCALTAPSAWSDTYWLVQHNQYYSSSYYCTITGDDVAIHHGVSGETFEFEAYTTDAQGAYVGSADIGTISADSDAGTVTITIVGHSGHPYGAADVEEINLGASGVDSRVDQLKISGDIGRSDGSGGIVSNYVADLDVGGDFNGTLYASAGTPPTGTVLDGGPLRVRRDVAGELYFADMTPDAYDDYYFIVAVDRDVTDRGLLAFQQGLGAHHWVWIGGELDGTIDLGGQGVDGGLVVVRGGEGEVINGGTLTGTVWIAWDGMSTFEGNVTVAAVDSGGVLECHGNLAGTYQVTGDLTAASQVWVGGSLSSTGEILIGGSVSASGVEMGALSGAVHVHGDLAGYIDVGTTMSGDIFIDGGFDDASSTQPEVAIASKDTAARFVVNDDGPDFGGQTWATGAVVKIGSAEYDEPDPAINLALATCYKGDANSDGAVDVYDIDPFVLAFDEEDYVAAFPYLQHSRIYRNDMSCDDNLGNLDFDAFVLRLQDPEQYFEDYPPGELPYQVCDSGDCLSGGTIDADTPAKLAALLEEYVSPERFDRLLTIVADLADHFWYCPKGQFWAEVLKELQS